MRTNIAHLALALMTACALSTSAALSVRAAATQFRFGFPPQQYNECTFENVLYQGLIHVVLDVTTGSDGSFHVFEHLDTEGVAGTGVITGDRYVYSQVSNAINEYDVSAQPTSTQTEYHLVLIHDGEALPLDDRYEHVVVKITWSNGVPTVVVDNTRMECK
jgi:hypothetical protein